MMNLPKTTLILVLIVFIAESFGQDVAPSRESFFISSKIKFRERDLKSEIDFLASYKDKFGAIEEKYNRNRALLAQMTKIENELQEKSKKTKEERSFLKMSFCLKRVLDVSEKKSNNEHFKVDDCYRIYRVKPSLFSENSPEDEISTLLRSLQENFVDNNFSQEVKVYLQAKERKDQIDRGSIEDLKNKISHLKAELERRLQFEQMIEQKLMKCKTELAIPLKEFKEIKPSDNFSFEAANDLLMSVTNDYKISKHTYYNINETNVDDIFTELVFKGYCTDRPRGDSLETCEGESSDLEKVVSLYESCKDRESLAQNLSGMSCLTDDFKKNASEKERKRSLENLRRTVVTNLSQGLTIAAKIDQKNNSIIGIKDDKGVCKYQIRDFSKKETYWVSEAEVFEKLNEIKYLVRYTRPED